MSICGLAGAVSSAIMPYLTPALDTIDAELDDADGVSEDDLLKVIELLVDAIGDQLDVRLLGITDRLLKLDLSSPLLGALTAIGKVDALLQLKIQCASTLRRPH